MSQLLTVSNNGLVLTSSRAWLIDISEALGKATPSGKPRQYYGFDINDNAFQGLPPLTHSSQDIYEPFPKQYHGKFDLVYLRYTFTFLKETALASVMKNLAQVLSPNGYLVWTELNIGTLAPVGNSPRYAEILDVGIRYMRKTGACTNLPRSLTIAAASESSLEICSETTVKPVHILSLEENQKWHHLSYSMFFPIALKILNEVPMEEAREQAKAMTREMEDFHAQGMSWKEDLCTLVVRKIAA